MSAFPYSFLCGTRGSHGCQDQVTNLHELWVCFFFKVFCGLGATELYRETYTLRLSTSQKYSYALVRIKARTAEARLIRLNEAKCWY